jgi:hypothetical protein
MLDWDSIEKKNSYTQQATPAKGITQKKNTNAIFTRPAAPNIKPVLNPQTFRNAPGQINITKEQQEKNTQVLLKELTGKQGKLSSFIMGTAGGFATGGLNQLLPNDAMDPRVYAQDKKNTFEASMIKNPRAVSQGFKPVEIVKSNVRFSDVGELAGQMIAADPVAVLGEKGVRLAAKQIVKRGVGAAEKASESTIKSTPIMSELERLAYESNLRKGKVKPQNDILYGNSFKPAAGELPAPAEEATSFIGRTNREVPRTITKNELSKSARSQLEPHPLPLNQKVTTKDGIEGKVVAFMPENNGIDSTYIIKPDGAKRKGMKAFSPEDVKPVSQKIEPPQLPKQNLKSEIKPNKEMSLFNKGYQKTVDNQFAISKATKGIKTTADKDPVILASNARNAKGTAEYAMKNGLVDREGRKITDYSLEQLLLRPKSEQEAYYDYLLHKHNIDRYRQGKPVFGEEITDKMSQQVVADYEKQFPQFKGLSDELSDFNGKLVDEWLVKSGLISKEHGDILKKMYRNYVPTFRDVGVKTKQQFKPRGLTPGQVVKKAVGGNDPIMALNKSYPAVVEKAIKSARKNEVYLGLLDTVEKNPEKMARWAKVVEDSAEKKYKDAIAVTDASEFMQKNGLDGVEDISKNQLAIDERSGKYYVTAMKNGKPVRMEVHKDLFDALNSLNRTGNEGVLDKAAGIVKNYATNPFKALITGYNPIFAVKNIFRDIPTSYIQGTENNPLKWGANLARAGKSMIKKDQQFEEFLALGGKSGNFFNVDKGLRIENIPTKALKKGAEKIGAFNNFTETLPRYGEYLGTLKREGGDYAAKQKGIYNAGEVTVNFNRHGDVTKAADQFVPYLNPSVQGIDKAVRNLKKPMTYAKAGLVVTVPTTAFYMLNQAVDKKGYDQLDNRTKDTNFLIPLGEGQFIKIPKSRESGVLFGSLFERLFRLAEGRQDSFKGFFAADGKPWKGTVGTNFAPANPIDNSIWGPALLNLKSNKDFAGRTIVPYGMENDKRSKYLQYDEQTSEIAKWFGEQARKIPGFEGGLSPKQIDYIIKSYTGIIGQVLQPATTKGQNPFENVIKRGFTADALYNNEVQNNFYDAYDQAMQIKTDKDLTEGIPKDYVTPEDKRISVFKKAADDMSELRKQEKEITVNMPNGKTKEAKLRELRQAILDVAQSTPENAEKEYQKYKQTYIPEISGMSEKQQENYRKYGKNLNLDLEKFAITIKQANKIESDKLQNGKSMENASRKKKDYIDSIFPDATQEQRKFLYEMAGISKTVGHYKPQFE